MFSPRRNARPRRPIAPLVGSVPSDGGTDFLSRFRAQGDLPGFISQTDNPKHVSKMPSATEDGPRGRTRDSTLGKERFERLLSALDPVPERAGELYERLRTKLTFVFVSRGRSSPLGSRGRDVRSCRAKNPPISGTRRSATRPLSSGAWRNFILKQDYRAPERNMEPMEDESMHPADTDDSRDRERLDEALAFCLKRLTWDGRWLIGGARQPPRAISKRPMIRRSSLVRRSRWSRAAGRRTGSI